MEIIRQNGEFTKGEVFNMTQGATMFKLSDRKGDTLNMSGWILYKDEDNKGNLQDVLVIKENDGELSATISKTFIDQFLKMADFMAGEDYKVKVVGGTSKSGREYITCEVSK